LHPLESAAFARRTPIPEIDRAIAATLRRLGLVSSPLWTIFNAAYREAAFPFINEVENVLNGGILLRTIPSARKPIRLR
jgi:hypothetical protein